nr:MAG TPA_asm: hypothetical protein [Caudoviricetes sp.]
MQGKVLGLFPMSNHVASGLKYVSHTQHVAHHKTAGVAVLGGPI